MHSLIRCLSNMPVRSCWGMSQYVHLVPDSSSSSSQAFIICKDNGFRSLGFLGLPGITMVSLGFVLSLISSPRTLSCMYGWPS